MADFYLGAPVSHDTHGTGKVSHFTQDMRVVIEFDNGQTHAYREASLKKLKLLDGGVDNQVRAT